MKHLKFKILILSIFLLSVFLNISNVFASETKEIELKFSHTFINETREQKDDIYIYAVQALDGAPLPTHIESRHCNARFINPADYGYTVPADTLLFAINARDGVAGRQGGREEFKFDEFTGAVFGGDEGLTESFVNYKSDYEQETQLSISEDFAINPAAVKKQQRYFKSVIKLDKNFHIYVHGDRKLIETGQDEKGKFYRLYFEEEQ